MPDSYLNFEELNETDAESPKDMPRQQLLELFQSKLNTEPRQALVACFKMGAAEETKRLADQITTE